MSEHMIMFIIGLLYCLGVLGVFIDCYYIIPRKVEKEMKENPIDFLFPKW